MSKFNDFIWNDVTLSFDATNPTWREKFEAAMEKYDEEWKEACVQKPASAMMKAQVQCFQNIFDRILGRGTSTKLLGKGPSVNDCTSCYNAFFNFQQQQYNKAVQNLTELIPQDMMEKVREESRSVVEARHQAVVDDLTERLHGIAGGKDEDGKNK